MKTHRRRAAALAVAVVATLALAAYALASATVTQTLSLDIKGKTSGKKPGAVAMKITEESVGPGPTDLERVPPKLDTATIKFDKTPRHRHQGPADLQAVEAREHRRQPGQEGL